MFTTRGHSGINTTPSVIMSLFCCRSLCLCIFLSCCLCLFILALSRSACRRSSLKFSLFALTLSRSTCRRSSLKFSPRVLTLSRSACRCSSLKSSLFVLACLFLLGDFLRENFVFFFYFWRALFGDRLRLLYACWLLLSAAHFLFALRLNLSSTRYNFSAVVCWYNSFRNL